MDHVLRKASIDKQVFVEIWFCLILNDLHLKRVWHKVVVRIFKQLKILLQVLKAENLKWVAEEGRYLKLRRIGIMESVHKTTQVAKQISSFN